MRVPNQWLGQDVRQVRPAFQSYCRAMNGVERVRAKILQDKL